MTWGLWCIEGKHEFSTFTAQKVNADVMTAYCTIRLTPCGGGGVAGGGDSADRLRCRRDRRLRRRDGVVDVEEPVVVGVARPDVVRPLHVRRGVRGRFARSHERRGGDALRRGRRWASCRATRLWRRASRLLGRRRLRRRRQRRPVRPRRGRSPGWGAALLHDCGRRRGGSGGCDRREFRTGFTEVLGCLRCGGRRQPPVLSVATHDVQTTVVFHCFVQTWIIQTTKDGLAHVLVGCAAEDVYGRHYAVVRHVAAPGKVATLARERVTHQVQFELIQRGAKGSDQPSQRNTAEVAKW